MKTKIAISIVSILFSLNIYSQTTWRNNALATPGTSGAGNLFGTSNPSPILVFTNGIHTARFTSLFSLGPALGGPSSTGDGLRIMPRTTGCGNPSTTAGTLDLWTSCSNETHIKWDGSGQISGQNNRFELYAQLSGFWFNTSVANARYIFNRQGIETGRIGSNSELVFRVLQSQMHRDGWKCSTMETYLNYDYHLVQS